MAILFHGVQHSRHVFQRNIIIELHVQAQSAFWHAERFHALSHVIEDLGARGEGDQLPVEVRIDRDDPFISRRNAIYLLYFHYMIPLHRLLESLF